MSRPSTITQCCKLHLRRLSSLLTLLLFLVNNLGYTAQASINIPEGFYYYDATDLAIGGLYSVSVERHYQSFVSGGGASKTGPFGYGTNMGAYSMRAEIVGVPSSSNSFVRLAMPTGGQEYFIPSGNNSYINQYRSDPIQGEITVSNISTSVYRIQLRMENGSITTFSSDTNSNGIRTLDSITDRFGKAVVFSYSGNNLIRVTDPFGRYIVFNYENTSFTSFVTKAGSFDNQGVNYGYVFYTYSSQGDLISFKNAINGQSLLDTSGQTRIANGVTEYTYNNHYLLTVKNPRNIVEVTNSYDGYGTTGVAGKVTQQKLPGTDATSTMTADDIIARYLYNSSSTTIQDTNASTDSQVEYYYEPSTKKINQTNYRADNSTWSFYYDNTVGGLSSSVNPFGQQLSFGYQFDGTQDRLGFVSNPDGTTTQFSYTASFGQISSATDENGYTTTYNYFPGPTALGQTQSVITPLPQTINYSYNSYGQLTSTQPQTYTYYDYPSGNQDLKSSSYLTETGSIAVCYEYDGISRLTATYYCNFSTKKTVYTYDKLNRVTQISRPADSGNGASPRVTKFTYDDNSNVTSVTAPNNVKTIYQYNDQDFLKSRQVGSRIEYLYYDNLGQITRSIDAKSQQTTYEYDAKRRLQRTTFADQTSLTLSYDALDHVTGIVDSSDPTGSKNIQLIFGNSSAEISRLKEVITAPGTVNEDHLQYHYDFAGNLIDISRAGSGELLRYSYYNDNSLKDAVLASQNDGLDLTSEFQYDGRARLLKYKIANVTADISYKYSDDISYIQFYTPSSTLLRSIQYFYDWDASSQNAKGRITAKLEGGQQVVFSGGSSYTYNEPGDLLSTTIGSNTYSSIYDLDGNPTSIKLNKSTTRATYEAGTNRMTAFGSRAVITDANGNITDDGIYLYLWNARDQLVTVKNKSNASVRASYLYDGIGRRIQKTIDGVTTRFIYSGNQVIEKSINGIKTRYLASLGLDSVLASRTNGTDEYYLRDASNGSLLSTVAPGSEPTVKTGYGYTSFGSVTKSNTASTTDLLFAGREDDGIGLYFYRSRYYSPELQRFISEDPVGFSGGDTNLYRYVSNIPHVDNDPMGLKPSALNNIASKLFSNLPSRILEGNVEKPNSKIARISPSGLSIQPTKTSGNPSTGTGISTFSSQDSRIKRDSPFKLAQVSSGPPIYLNAGGSFVEQLQLSCSAYCENTFTANGLPPGTTATWNPNPLILQNGEAGFTFFTFSTSATTPPGTYRVQTYNSGSALYYYDFVVTEAVVKSVYPGQQTSYSLTLSDSSLPTTYTVSGLPSGATASFSPNPVFGTSYTTMTVVTTEDTPIGDYPLTASGNNGSAPPFNTPFILKVVPRDVVLSSSNPNQTTTASRVTYPITLTRVAGDTTPITLSTEGLPTGLTPSFNPPITSGNSATLAIDIDPSLPEQTIQFAVTGSGKNIRTDKFSLRVETIFLNLVASPNPQAILAGSSAQYAISILRREGYSGSVNLALDGALPGSNSGLGLSLSPQSTTGNSATLTVTSAPDALLSNYFFSIKGTYPSDPQIRIKPADIGLTVVPAQVDLTASPTSQTIKAGTYIDYSINIARSTGYTGALTLAVSGLPSGATATLTPANPNSSSSASLRVATESTIAPGYYPLQIEGSAQNAQVNPASVGLFVDSSQSSSSGTSTPGRSIPDLERAGSQMAGMGGLNNTLNNIRNVAGIVSLVPGLNVPASLVSAGIAVYQGDYIGAGIDLAGLVPGVADAVRVGRVAEKAVQEASIVRNLEKLASACECFVAGTLVQTQDGLVPIEKVQVGQKVLSRDEQTDEQSFHQVLQTITHGEQQIYRLTLNQQQSKHSEELEVTAEHPFYLKDKGWTPTIALRPGDVLRTLNGWVSIEQLQVTDLKKTTYNLEVETDHSYFVGNDLIWVHNAGCGMLGKQATQDLDASIANSLGEKGWIITHGAGTKQEAISSGVETGRRGRPPGTLFPDITAIKDGVTMRIQTVDTKMVGGQLVPTNREMKAINEIIRRKPNDILYWFPKGPKW